MLTNQKYSHKIGDIFMKKKVIKITDKIEIFGHNLSSDLFYPRTCYLKII